MSALGHQQTYAPQKRMSALHPSAQAVLVLQLDQLVNCTLDPRRTRGLSRIPEDNGDRWVRHERDPGNVTDPRRRHDVDTVA